MGNYRQHLGFATVFGVTYAGLLFALAGVHWIYGTVAAMLSILGGLLPDVDSDSGMEMKTFTGIMGVLGSVAVWKMLDVAAPGLPFELHLCVIVLTYVGVKWGLKHIVGKLTVHRGMCHSLPTGCVWGALTYLYYPTDHHGVRVTMSVGVMLGFLSHLLLDEMCSVDLKGARVNKAFGTALKFWSNSAWSTLIVYAMLGYLSWRVIDLWPADAPLLGDSPACAIAGPDDPPRPFSITRPFERTKLRLPPFLRSLSQRIEQGQAPDSARLR